MIRVVLVGAAFFSPFFFPIGMTALLALVGAVVSPLVPLLVGLLVDTLYYGPGTYAFPLYSLLGGLATLGAFGMHRFVETSIMRA
ncbi:MAG: hypothetical protein Q7R54_01540 [bacterium]|nr:hypothetical protein [bacterium]